MKKEKKSFMDNLDLWKKIAQTILVTAPVLALLGTAIGWTFKTIYQKEIDEFKKTVKFSILARDSLIPTSRAEHIGIMNRIEALESKHSEGFAVGLRYNTEEEKMYYKAEDGSKYEAHQDPDYGRWYYIKEGQPYFVYE